MAVQRTVLWLLLLVTLGMGCWAFLGRGDVAQGTQPPMVPPVATGDAQPATGTAMDAASTPVPSGSGLPHPVDRTEMPPPTAGGSLRVMVVDEAARGVPGIDVACLGAAADGLGEFAAQLETAADGAVTFQVPLQAPRQVTVATAVAGEQTALVRADQRSTLTLRVRARAVLTGSVVDAAGRGLAGATLVLLPWSERASTRLPAVLQIGRTAADGSFRCPITQGGQIGALHPDFAPSSLQPVVLSRDPTEVRTLTVRLVLLTAMAAVRGFVVDDRGAPIAGAWLEIAPLGTTAEGSPAGPPMRAASGADGAYRIGHLRPGMQRWTARATGYGTAGGTFEVAAGAVAERQFVLGPPGTITGQVVDGHGAPLAKALVTAGQPGLPALQTARSDADGRFMLPELGAGTYELQASAGRLHTRGSVDLQPGGTATWQATLAAAGDGPAIDGVVELAGGAPGQGFRVSVAQDGASPVLVTTDADGRFRVPLRGTGTLQLHAYAANQALDGFPSASLLDVPPGRPQGSAPVRLVVDLPGHFGTVVGRVESMDRAPLAASLVLWHHELRRTARCAAAADGSFRIERVPPGSFDLYVDCPGHAGLTRQSIAIAAFANLDLGTLVLGPAASLHGSVTGPDGQPPASLEIYLLTADQRLDAEYAGGTYRLGRVPPGRHVLRVQGPQVAAATFDVEVPAGVALQQDLRLLAGVHRSIAVSAPEGSGNWITLVITDPVQKTSWLSGQPRPAGGTATFDAWLAPGTYRITARGTEPFQATTEAVFGPGQDQPIRLDLSR